VPRPQSRRILSSHSSSGPGVICPRARCGTAVGRDAALSPFRSNSSRSCRLCRYRSRHCHVTGQRARVKERCRTYVNGMENSPYGVHGDSTTPARHHILLVSNIRRGPVGEDALTNSDLDRPLARPCALAPVSTPLQPGDRGARPAGGRPNPGTAADSRAQTYPGTRGSGRSGGR
jgi:hypothetical protein